MWIARKLYDHLVEETRLSRAVAAQLEAQLEAARAENEALRRTLRETQEATEGDRAALREAATSLHAHLQAGNDQLTRAAEKMMEDAERAVARERQKVAALHERVAVADTNFGWCRTLVNMMQAERTSLLSQRGIIVPTMSLTDTPTSPAAPPVAGIGVPGTFDDADALASAMGVSFEDVGDDAARRLKLTPDDSFL